MAAIIEIMNFEMNKTCEENTINAVLNEVIDLALNNREAQVIKIYHSFKIK